MADQIFFEDVTVGAPIPTLTVTVGEAQMFFFSAAVYNGHRIHYDKTWATEVEGYPNILVQGALQTALLARAVTDWMGPAGRLVSYGMQNRASAFPGEELRFAGTVTGTRDGSDSGRGLVDLEIRGEKGDAADPTALTPGTATVSLPRRA